MKWKEETKKSLRVRCSFENGSKFEIIQEETQKRSSKDDANPSNASSDLHRSRTKKKVGDVVIPILRFVALVVSIIQPILDLFHDIYFGGMGWTSQEPNYTD